MSNIFDHFELWEFNCKCGYCGLGFPNMNREFIGKLAVAREYAGIAFTLNSAIRCKSYNKEIDGKPNSAHLTGHAVDIKCANSMSRFIIVNALLKAGFNRIGIYPRFIHADSSPNLPDQVMWIEF